MMIRLRSNDHLRPEHLPGEKDTQRSGKRSQPRIGAPIQALTPNAGLAAITGLCDRLGVISALDRAVGPIKQRDRESGPGSCWRGWAERRSWPGRTSWWGWIASVLVRPGSSHAVAGTEFPRPPRAWPGGSPRRGGQAVEGRLAAVTGRMLAMLPAPQAAALADRPVTIDLDTTDVEVYGRKKRGVACNHQGQRAGRPHVASWAETEIVLAADLGDGTDDPRATAPDLLRRALAALPQRARASERVALRADAGYFAGALAAPPTRRASASRSAPSGSRRCGGCWPRRGRLARCHRHGRRPDRRRRVLPGLVAGEYPAADPPGPAGPGAGLRPATLRRRRTLHPDQRALPFAELARAGAIYAYSFILTSLDISSPDNAVAAGHWYRHRTTVENIFRDSKPGAALRHLPSGYPQVNTAWMWGALLAASMAAWLHQLTAVTAGEDILAGHSRAAARP